METDSPWWFSGPVEKQQLCHLAKKEADLPFMDYNIAYNWYKYDNHGLVKVMRCPTLPTMFVVKEDIKNIIQITFLESRINDIKFNTGVIRRFDLISREIKSYDEQSSKPSRLARLSAEDRKNLCDTARRFVNVVFLDDEVSEAWRYKFSDTSHQEVHFSLVCPTSPKLCLYDGNVENEVELLVVRDVVNRYTFEVDKAEPESVLLCKMGNLFENFNAKDLIVFDSNDRLKLCVMSRKFASLPGTDTIVHEAETYSFKFEGGQEIRDIAIHCSRFPEFYLRLTDPLKYKMNMIFVQNPYDRYTYTIEFFDFIHATRSTAESRRKIIGHWLSTLGPDDRWKLCYAAQKHIPHSLRLETTPLRYVESPTVEEFVRRYPVGGIRESNEDVAIRCSGIPEMYVRTIQQSKEVDNKKVVQIALHAFYFDIPEIRTIYDDYREEQDNYDG